MTTFNARNRRSYTVAAGLLALCVGGVGLGESTGWPFLIGPMQRALGSALHRTVSFSEDPSLPPKVTLHLLGGVAIQAPYILIGAPPWSSTPHLLLARDAHMALGYADLWRASRGAPLRIRELRAAALDARLDRLADGRASWQFAPADPAGAAAHLPVFEGLQVEVGTLGYQDAVDKVDLNARFSARSSGQHAGAGSADPTLQFEATGTYLEFPLKVELRTSSPQPAGAATVFPLTLEAVVGRARLSFAGTATDVVNFGALQGRFSLQGPSLAAVGDPLRVTLPTTGPFRARGLIVKKGEVWNTVLEQINVGSSRLAGAFTYDPRPRVPLLAGRLTGPKLLLADLGPAVGLPVAPDIATAPTAKATKTRAKRVLPDRPFDLPALRAMDANVLVDIDSFDLGSRVLEPLQPLHTHLVLAGGLLTLSDLDARAAQGRLSGAVQLDGRDALALWTADLRLGGVRLEHWLRQKRSENAPPYVSGSLNGQARLTGQGQSTAAILSSLHGSVRLQLVDGTISHLVVEAAGIDVAESLGVLFTGDDSLKVQCGVADLVAEQGVLRPRAMVLDTSDSTLWADGSISLVGETLDLRMLVAPKDFTLLALRSPVHVTGSFASPAVSLEKGPLGARIGAAALLAFVNPLAALIPLVDVGSSDDAQRGADECRALSGRIATRPLRAPSSATPARAFARHSG